MVDWQGWNLRIAQSLIVNCPLAWSKGRLYITGMAEHRKGWPGETGKWMVNRGILPWNFSSLCVILSLVGYVLDPRVMDNIFQREEDHEMYSGEWKKRPICLEASRHRCLEAAKPTK